MSIKIGSISAKNIYIGSTPAKEIRLGSTLIWSRAQEEVYYTLTVNLDGDYEAYYDGYTIYVNGLEFARIDSSNTFAIPAGAVVSTYNNSNGINGYSHSETINPSPLYNNDGSWIMDNDYIINVTAEQPMPMVTINIETWYPKGEGFITTRQIIEDGIVKEDTRTFQEKTVLSYTVPWDSNFEILSLWDEAHTSFNVYSPNLPSASGEALFTFAAIGDGTIIIEATSS